MLILSKKKIGITSYWKQMSQRYQILKYELGLVNVELFFFIGKRTNFGDEDI